MCCWFQNEDEAEVLKTTVLLQPACAVGWYGTTNGTYGTILVPRLTADPPPPKEIHQPPRRGGYRQIGQQVTGVRYCGTYVSAYDAVQ